MPRLAAEAKEERRRRLVDATRRCAARKGFSELTVDEVCAEAGVSKGAFYIYFDSKPEMLLALMEEDASFTDAMLGDSLRPDTTATDALRGFIRAMVRRGEDPAMAQIRADLWATMLTDKTLRARFSNQVGERRRQLRARIEEATSAGELVDVPANALASILLALGDGLTLHSGLDPSAFRWPNIKRALDVILEGLSRPRAMGN